MTTARRPDLAPALLALLGDGEAAAPELRGRLAGLGVPLSPLAFDGLLAALEVRGVVRGRYAPEAEHDRSSPRLYRRGPHACPADGRLRPAA